MKTLKIHKPILDMVLNAYLKHFIWKLNYYENLHDPEFCLNQGIQLGNQIHFTKHELESERGNVEYHREQLNNFNPEKTKFEFLNEFQLFEAIKQVIREQLTFAYNHNENKYIVQRGLKRSVLALDFLRLNNPNFDQVTPRFFLHYNNLN
jgi:hypothetical protein